MIVIVATEEDVAVRDVVRALHIMGRRDVLWLDLEKAHDQMLFESRVENGAATWRISSRQDPALSVSEENVSAVYWRRPISYLGSPFMGIPTSANLDFVEIFWSIRWHLEALPAQLFPLGHPWIFGRAENKHRQMAAALKVGFEVPPTLHSNNPAQLQEFISTQQKVAIKALRMPAVTTTGSVKDARHIACKSFAAEELNAHLSGRDRCQLYCQSAIDRDYDLRITVLPHQTICVAIDTTSLEGNKLDWREDSLQRHHELLPVEPEFERQLRAYLLEMELTAGYFDFAVPKSGRPVFFECNTNAQWHWMEVVTGFSFSQAVAQELAWAWGHTPQ